MVVLAAYLSKKINCPRLAALLGLVLLIIGINGLIDDDMPELAAILIIVVAVMNVLRLLPQHDDADTAASEAAAGDSPG